MTKILADAMGQAYVKFMMVFDDEVDSRGVGDCRFVESRKTAVQVNENERDSPILRTCITHLAGNM